MYTKKSNNKKDSPKKGKGSGKSHPDNNKPVSVKKDAVYEEKEEDWSLLLHDDAIDAEYNEYDNEPFGHNSGSNQDGFGSRGNSLQRGKHGLSRNYRMKNKGQQKNNLMDNDSNEDPKPWRTSMSDW